MKRRIIILLCVLGASLGGLGVLISSTGANQAESLTTDIPIQGSFPLPEPGGIYLNRRTDGIENAFNQAIFGPKSCTAYGDPFSPINSYWEPGIYTYKYRILIPPEYQSNIVRVELFDPDSINSNIMSTTLYYSQIAVDKGAPATGIAECTEDQRHPCVAETQETSLLDIYPDLRYDQLNPFWMIRIDENRGGGLDDGNGKCVIPTQYSPQYNTQTLFELSYNTQDINGTSQSIPLAWYTGQSGDGQRDQGDHNTDMRWVSPGAAKSFDQPIFVPTDPGSPGSFEVDLTADVPGIIVNPLTGYRELFLDITAVSGASENGFDIWAGPPDYVNSIPSEVNARNLHIVNNPQSHSSNGITVFSLDTLPQNSNIKTRLELPLVYLDPQYAGQTITMTAFDLDNTNATTISIYMDTIATPDWNLEFGISGGIDPDGVPADDRCLPGKCNDEWFFPQYQIHLPDFTDECDLTNQDPQKCTPFYGGRLMVSFISGKHDTYAWKTKIPPKPILDNTKTCTLFPIAFNENIDSVSAPTTELDSNQYPAAIEFDFPLMPPSYSSFISHIPNVPLAQAKEGYIYRFYDGYSSGNFSWLRWNNGRPDNDETLRDSILWPGNSSDYIDHEYTQLSPPSPLFSWIVDGYVNPKNNLDISLSIHDWVLGKSNQITSTIVQNELNEHITKNRTLRLLIWDEGDNQEYRIAKVGIFRLIGYHIDETTGSSWLTVEFVRWDTSCAQSLVNVQNVSLFGPKTGLVNNLYTFVANIQPATATLPVVYTWKADDLPETIHENTFQDEITFSWSEPGLKFITVTAQNKGGYLAQFSYSIDVDLNYLYLPTIMDSK